MILTAHKVATTLFDEFDFDTLSPNVKEELEFDEDVLIYIVAMRRMNMSLSDIVHLLSKKQVKYSYITEDDRKEADCIRRYYETQYFTKRMSGKELTDYQETIVRVLRDRYILFDKDVPALVKLPEFYYFDTAVDTVIESCVSIEEKDITVGESHTLKLNPVTSLNLKRRSSKQKYYYFTTENKHMVMINLDNYKSENAFDFMFDKFKTISLNGYWNIKQLNGFNYITSNNVSVVDVV